MTRRFGGLVILAFLFSMTCPLASRADCTGTSGAALINGTNWSAQCVIAGTSTDCVDSTGTSYECFQIFGTDSTGAYAGIGIFLQQEPVQGQTYNLGGSSGNGAMVVGQTGIWITANDPFVGQVQVTVYSPGSSAFECNFSFVAQSLFLGPEVTVSSGVFVGKLLAVEPKTWADVKRLYRTTR